MAIFVGSIKLVVGLCYYLLDITTKMLSTVVVMLLLETS